MARGRVQNIEDIIKPEVAWQSVRITVVTFIPIDATSKLEIYKRKGENDWTLTDTISVLTDSVGQNPEIVERTERLQQNNLVLRFVPTNCSYIVD